MNLMLWVLALVAFDGPVKVDVVTLLQPISEDSDYFLQSPSSFDVDASGNYYLVDAEAQVVFKWNKDGTYNTSIGQPGEGPGEFQFGGGRGPGAGFITSLDSNLYIYDARKRQVLVFNEQDQFEKTLDFNTARARANNFYAMPGGQFMIHLRRFNEEGIFSEVKLIDNEGKPTKTLASMKDDTFNISGSQGRRRFMIKAYNPTIVSHYDRVSGEVLIGNSEEPAFEVHDKTGATRKIRLPLTAREVTQEDKDEYMKRFENQRRAPEVSFPDKKAFYTHLLSLGGDGYLVYSQSPYYNRIEGVHLNKKGDILGRVDLESGNGGGLMGAGGRVLWISLDEDEEFLLKEIKLGKRTS